MCFLDSGYEEQIMSRNILDQHGQPINRSFNYGRNREKCAYALRGLLQGVVADEKLDAQELLFLDIWLRNQQYLDNGDVVDMLHMIGEILEDGTIKQAELDELNEVINDVINYGQDESDEMEPTINELLGILLGISADGKVTEKELEVLDDWLNRNKHIAEHWPANFLHKRIRMIKEDGVVTQEELDDLLGTVKQMSGQHFEETGSADGGVAEIFSDEIEQFNHDGKSICFTGKFVCGTRNAVEKTAREKGAVICHSINQSLDALVVGTLASRDWRFTSHGRKIEKVLMLKNAGRPILILSERHWLKFA